MKPLELFSVRPPRKVKAGLLVSVQMPPLLMVTAPTNKLVPVAELSFKVPVIEDVPVTVRLAVVSCRVPEVMVRFPLRVVLPPSVAVWPESSIIR